MRLPILVIHICGGLVGLLYGIAAVSFRKGSNGIAWLEMGIFKLVLSFWRLFKGLRTPDRLTGSSLSSL